MKHIISLLLLVCMISQAESQTPTRSVTSQDQEKIIRLCDLYSPNQVEVTPQMKMSLDSLRDDRFNRSADIIMAMWKGDMSVLDKKILSRPSDDELMIWYAIIQLSFRRLNDSLRTTDLQRLDFILSTIPENRVLFATYYGQLSSPLSFLFNKSNLKKVNINMDEYGFKDSTERAVFYLSLVNGLVGQRYMVLMFLKKPEKIVEFASKMPQVNGKAYYLFKDLDFPDFEIPHDNGGTSYSSEKINELLNVLMYHVYALEMKGEEDLSKEIYYNSVLHEEKYFKFSKIREVLEDRLAKSR